MLSIFPPYNKYSVKFLANQVYEKFYNSLYKNGIKSVTQEWLDKITPLGLAIWFMDDGSNCGTIATNCFTKAKKRKYSICYIYKDKLEKVVL